MTIIDGEDDYSAISMVNNILYDLSQYSRLSPEFTNILVKAESKLLSLPDKQKGVVFIYLLGLLGSGDNGE